MKWFYGDLEGRNGQYEVLVGYTRKREERKCLRLLEKKRVAMDVGQARRMVHQINDEKGLVCEGVFFTLSQGMNQ